MTCRRTGTLLGAAGLIAVLAVGLAGPASAATITPIHPVNPVKQTRPVTAPAPAPKGRRVPFPGLSPTQIKDRAAKNARTARSVRVRGGADGADGERLTWDLTLARTAGTMTFTSTVEGSFSVIRIGERVWLSGDEQFWLVDPEVTEEEARDYAGDWIEFVGDNDFTRGMRTRLTIGEWVGGLGSFRVTKRVVGKSIGGRRTVGLYEPGQQGAVLYVAASGPTYPLAAESNDGTTTLSYSNWNQKVSINAPARYVQVTVDAA